MRFSFPKFSSDDEMERLIYNRSETPAICLQRFGKAFPKHNKLLGEFHNLVSDLPADETIQIDIRDVHGILHSKSGLWDLNEFRKIIDFETLFSSYRDSEAVAKSVFEGESSDYVARKGEPVVVDLQEWDQVVTIVNMGGSHRFAALRFCHLDHGEERLMDCRLLTRWRLNPACIALAQQYQFSLMSWDNELELSFWHQPFVEKVITSFGPCYAYRKTLFNSFLLDRLFAKAFNLSEFILRLSCPGKAIKKAA